MAPQVKEGEMFSTEELPRNHQLISNIYSVYSNKPKRNSSVYIPGDPTHQSQGSFG
jgi:hypothetical protein